ncbi:hypothetical protein [Ammoniphilus sp. 3BR4]|uniref:hypothetical protein n=1 Tax=Ammoniphilus sp. 3BR4 TaxID=3158265 RepID=UPI003466ED24
MIRLDGAGAIAYTSDRGGTFDIWLNRPMTALNYPLTRGLGEEYSVPYWSADSRFLCYVKNGRIGIYDIISHSSSSILQEGAFNAQWFPSGRELFLPPQTQQGSANSIK